MLIRKVLQKEVALALPIVPPQPKVMHPLRQKASLRESEAQGLWDCCGYFISHANDTTIVAANAFQGLVTGDTTNIETSVINLWQPTLR